MNYIKIVIYVICMHTQKCISTCKYVCTQVWILTQMCIHTKEVNLKYNSITAINSINNAIKVEENLLHIILFVFLCVINIWLM